MVGCQSEPSGMSGQPVCVPDKWTARRGTARSIVRHGCTCACTMCAGGLRPWVQALHSPWGTAGLTKWRLGQSLQLHCACRRVSGPGIAPTAKLGALGASRSRARVTLVTMTMWTPRWGAHLLHKSVLPPIAGQCLRDQLLGHVHAKRASVKPRPPR